MAHNVKMNVEFKKLADQMPALFERLNSKPPRTIDNLEDIPKKGKGIYVFHEKGKPLYVGRSNRLKDRLLEHGQEGSKPNSASFAFILTRKKLGFPPNTKRKQVEQHQNFEDTFLGEKKRVRKMKICVVQIADDKDQLKQALFEIYAAVALNTPYNDFSTH